MTEDEWKEFDALIATKIAETFFVVEANGYESLMLWKEFSDHVDWKQDNPGVIKTVGHLDGRPVSISLSWQIINGKRILFWDACSQVVDHKMIDAWLAENVHPPKWDVSRPAFTDAMNFHHCLDALGWRGRRAAR